MSYARFGWDNSDVYVFLHVGGFIECCACVLAHEDWEPFHAGDTQTMVNHLKKHEISGHVVPPSVYERLWEDHEENMEFIRNKEKHYSKELPEDWLETLEEIRNKIAQAEENNEE